jgi:hypothetical protein|tara:strand:+ start:199 stop:672 length:474 start_codon:yes stop_codon:yes gene_type:complete
MALEDEIKSLKETVAQLVDVTKELLAVRTEAVETVRTAAAPKTTGAKATAAAEAKPAASSTDASTISVEVGEKMSAAIAGYIAGATRDEERAARKDKIKALLRHDQIVRPEFKAVTETYDALQVKPEAVQLFFDQIGMLVQKGDLTQPAASNTALNF